MYGKKEDEGETKESYLHLWLSVNTILKVKNII